MMTTVSQQTDPERSRRQNGISSAAGNLGSHRELSVKEYISAIFGLASTEQASASNNSAVGTSGGF